MGDVMNNKFEASNGVTLDVDGPRVRMSTGDFIYHDELVALREFFQHERDEELGRWRSKKHPDYVVYPGRNDRLSTSHERSIIMNERNGTSATGVLLSASEDWAGATRQVIDEYNDAHPKQEPWLGALPDDVWKFTSKDRERKALAWPSWDDWDVMDPRGKQIRAVDDPVAALIENGYEEFAELASAVRMTEASDVAE